MDLARGDVVVVDFGGAEGASERLRPALVVQNDVGNEYGSTTVVVPLTTDYGTERYPHEVLVRAGDSGLTEHAVALCSQPRTVAIDEQLVERLGSVPEDTMLDVDRALEYSLDLGGPLE